MDCFAAVCRRSLRFRFAAFLFFAGLSLAARPALGQLPLNPTQPQAAQPNELTDPTATPGSQFLYRLDAEFSADVAKGGGKAFASWFAPDAVTLANGKAPVIGEPAIAAAATWTPRQYQLTWKTEGARMGPEGDSGFTWGTYTGAARDNQGNLTRTKGRYITIWKKQPDGQWKVELDASNDGPPTAGDCCRLPGS